MKEARNAFGVFTHTRTKNDKMYGQGSQNFTGAIIFWKDHYFIAITANDDNEPIRSAMKRIGDKIDAKIHTKGELPAIVDLLPDDGLEPNGFLYFHHYIWQNAYYYISNDNFLNIDSDTDAILAKYGSKDNRYYLLIVQYPDATLAEKACDSFRKHFPEAGTSTGQSEDNNWMGATCEQEYLIAVFNALQEEAVTNLMQEAENKINKPIIP